MLIAKSKLNNQLTLEKMYLNKVLKLDLTFCVGEE